MMKKIYITKEDNKLVKLFETSSFQEFQFTCNFIDFPKCSFNELKNEIIDNSHTEEKFS